MASPPPRPPTFKAKALGAQVMPTMVTSFSPIGLGISLAAAKESERRTGVHKSLTVNRLPTIAVPPRSYSTSYYF
ncbi:uncharacterized protein LAESUDRAFT_721729 [Laetiporus sulphureus 93-53]|uniref:Uncharacterized protein n=1 Tax=Laetiporus sulphureus 93-53 TaxID=1314785 RepID=A0A165GI73_9APHY|nr:uncharacterized protein LAESUDRAFT_721729 [Laetiporus sulphureus 93-53]KZT10384.1 hypothetical protein LAESUDRAFT_721729 [Laetiporus sulphureus 93-53]